MSGVNNTIPSGFLALAPATSDSYPQTARPAPSGNAVPRRASSSSNSGIRILKLGPVHWGEHQEDHKDDFYELSSSP